MLFMCINMLNQLRQACGSKSAACLFVTAIKNHRDKHVCVQWFKGQATRDKKKNESTLLSCRFLWELSHCEFVAKRAEAFLKNSSKFQTLTLTLNILLRLLRLLNAKQLTLFRLCASLSCAYSKC